MSDLTTNITAYLEKLLEQERYKELNSYLSKAIAADPNLLTHYLWYGMSKLQQKYFHEAYLYALHACYLSPLSAEAFALKSIILRQLGQLSRARTALEKAIYLDPLNTVYIDKMKDLLEKLQFSESYIKKSIYITEKKERNFTSHSYQFDIIKTNKVITHIDIIIPVYSDFNATKNCIESVLSSLEFNKKLIITILVINDASTDKKIINFLYHLQKLEKIELVTNKKNQGFINTVNRGLAIHLDRDILLLNADTYVNNDWLERLHSAAYSEKKIASVTPLSNNAELVSFPTPMQNNKLKNIKIDSKKIDCICKTVNNKNTVDIPTGVGFCMYIRRSALNEAGFLDANELYRGYGEEVDLCFRFKEYGWKNKCAVNVFIAHLGGSSFGYEKRSLVVQNLNILRKKYPFYEKTYEQFLKIDLLKKYRIRIEEELLKENNKKYTLILSPVGGISNARMHSTRLSKAKDYKNYIYLYKKNNSDDCFLSEDINSSYNNLRYKIPKDKEKLKKHLLQLKINAIELYDIISFNKEILDIISDLNKPYNIYLSDFSPICQNITLFSSKKTICNKIPDETSCQKCINNSLYYFMPEIKNKEYRQWMYSLLKKAMNVFVATEEIKQRISCQINISNFIVEQHSYYIMPNLAVFSKKITVMVLFSKEFLDESYRQFFELVRYTIKIKFNILFIKIGFSSGDSNLLKTNRVKIFSESIFDNNIDEFIVSSGIDVILDLDILPKADYYYLIKLMPYKLPVSLISGNLPKAWASRKYFFSRDENLKIPFLFSHLLSICRNK